MADKPIIKNKSVLGELDVPLLRKFVAFGEEVEVEVEHAENLLAQYVNWDAVNDVAKAIVAKIRAAEEARNAVPAPTHHIEPVSAPDEPAPAAPVIPTPVAPVVPVVVPVVSVPAAPAPDATEATK